MIIDWFYSFFKVVETMNTGVMCTVMTSYFWDTWLIFDNISLLEIKKKKKTRPKLLRMKLTEKNPTSNTYSLIQFWYYVRKPGWKVVLNVNEFFSSVFSVFVLFRWKMVRRCLTTTWVSTTSSSCWFAPTPTLRTAPTPRTPPAAAPAVLPRLLIQSPISANPRPPSHPLPWKPPPPPEMTTTAAVTTPPPPPPPPWTRPSRTPLPPVTPLAPKMGWRPPARRRMSSPQHPAKTHSSTQELGCTK